MSSAAKRTSRTLLRKNPFRQQPAEGYADQEHRPHPAGRVWFMVIEDQGCGKEQAEGPAPEPGGSEREDEP